MGEVFFCWISDLVSDAETDDSLGILDTKFMLFLFMSSWFYYILIEIISWFY